MLTPLSHVISPRSPTQPQPAQPKAPSMAPQGPTVSASPCSKNFLGKDFSGARLTVAPDTPPAPTESQLDPTVK